MAGVLPQTPLGELTTLLLIIIIKKCTYLSDTVTQNAEGALYTVNKVPGYNIGGNSDLATSGSENSSEKEMFLTFPHTSKSDPWRLVPSSHPSIQAFGTHPGLCCPNYGHFSLGNT